VFSVVALADQWYLKYGEASWQAQVRGHVEATLETYTPQTKRDFLGAVEWLHEWACSRSYGMGSKLPWDEQYVIESLSDSTIYMAYYTIAHLLQGGSSGSATAESAAFLTGAQVGLAGIPASELTDDVWNYIFLSKEFPALPAGSAVPAEKLEQLRNAFEYWYPMDLRVSGKDLIPNHLTMSLYNHAAIWPEESEQRWPRSMFTNGFMMIDGGKMSKSTGNFVTLAGAVEEYSADATRFALADAGDGLEDANFERKSANAAILKLTKEETWIKEMVEWDAKNQETPLRTGPLNFFDKVFLNELTACTVSADAAYSKLVFRDALKYAFHQLTIDRDNYRLALDAEKACNLMHRDVIFAYVEKLSVLLSPICPHFCQHIWQIAGLAAKHNEQFVARASWPSVTAADVDPLLQRQISYLRDTAVLLRKGLLEALERFGKVPKPKAGEKPIVVEKWIKDIATAAAGGLLIASDVVKLLDHCTLYIAADYPEWQAHVLRLVSSTWEELNGRKAGVYPDLKSVLGKLRASLPAGDKKSLEAATKFASTVLADLALRGPAALELASPFSEQELLEAHWDFVLRDLGITRERVVIRQGKDGPAIQAPVAGGAAAAAAGAPSAEAQAQAVEAIAASKALPGRPSPYFYKKAE
jgi:leucyl-tRNA synthetase